MLTVAEEIGLTLRRFGVKWVFGLPGGETVDLLEGFRKAGLAFFLSHHETAAAIMAATVGDLLGTPGVVCTTLGPGATNAVTGVAQALLDRSPLLVLIAQIPDSRIDVTPHQRLDLQALFRPISKSVARVEECNVSETIRWAVELASEGTPGPVVLEVASDMQRRPVSSSQIPHPDISRNRWSPHRAIDSHALHEARRLLETATRPIAIFGLEAAREGDIQPSARAFVESWRLPFMTLPKSKGVVPESHDLFLGTLETAGTDRLFSALEESDLAVMVGVDAVEFDRFWDFPCKVLSISSSRREDGYCSIHVELLGDVGRTLLELSNHGTLGKWTDETIKTIRSSVAPDSERNDRISRHRTIEILREILPADTILTSDTGTNKAVSGQRWKADQPLSYLVSNGLSTMGYALPAAIAAKLVFPERPVLAVMGDGGLLMTFGELATAARLGTPIVGVVFVDHALDAIRKIQMKRGLPIFGTEFEAGDLGAAATAFGWKSATVRSEDELRSVALQLGSATHPTLLQVDVGAGNAFRDGESEDEEALARGEGSVGTRSGDVDGGR